MAPALKIVMAGGTLRYLLSRPSRVSVEILDASGRILLRIPESKQAGGWHSIPLSGPGSRSNNAGAGVYFARFSMDGNYQSTKRIFVMR